MKTERRKARRIGKMKLTEEMIKEIKLEVHTAQ